MDQIPVNSNGGGGGNSWPPALRRRLGLPSTTCSSKSNSSNDHEHSGDIDILTTTTQSSSTASSLSSHELRQYIHKTYSTLTSIQRQLHRGEESYFEQSYSHGNLLQGWDNIWIEQHHNHNNSNSYTNSSGGMYSSMGEDGTSNNVSNNHAHHMNNNKSIPIRKMPAEYRWFTSSCGTNLPITSTTDNSNGGISVSGSGRVAALERWSLIDRPLTPELQEKRVASKEVDISLMKKDEVNVAVTSLVDNRVKEEGIGSRSNDNDNTAQSAEDTVAVKVESNMASTANESHQVNGKKIATAERTMDIDSSSKVVAKTENQPIKDQPSKVANTEPHSHHPSSSGQSSTDTERVIEKTASSTLEFTTTRKDETNDTTSTRLRDASSSCNIQPSLLSSSPTAAAAADDKYQTNTTTIQSNKQTETTSSNGDNCTDNIVSSTIMDHPKNSIAEKDSSEMKSHTTIDKGMTQEQGSSTSVSLPQSKRARVDTNQLSKDDGSTADDTTSSKADMNINLSKEHDDDQEETKEEEEEKTETLPSSSTAVAGGSRTSSSRRSTRKRKTT